MRQDNSSACQSTNASSIPRAKTNLATRLQMDRAALEQLLQEAESILHRGEQNMAHQHEVIETLARVGTPSALANS